jgi:hypothetical protein
MNEMKVGNNQFLFHVDDDSIEIEKFKLTIQDDNKNEWVEYFEVPIKKNVEEIKDFEIADGKIFTVAKSGNDTETILLGKGNGDGVANPGESIVILVKDQNKYWRTDLSFSDEYVNPFGINTRMSDDWSSLDHVGASAKYSVPVVSSDCPANHVIDFFAEYWLPEYPLHIIKQGVVKIKVTSKDVTAPIINWINVAGDNTIQTKIYDGSKIKSVTATFILKEDPQKRFQLELKDDGSAGDKAEDDNVFSATIPEQKFSFFRVIIEATDSFGNKTAEEAPHEFVLH